MRPLAELRTERLRLRASDPALAAAVAAYYQRNREAHKAAETDLENAVDRERQRPEFAGPRRKKHDDRRYP